MLPTKTFADAVAFLRLFDLSPLLVTNSLCSSLAVEASTSLRCEAFPGLAFYVLDRGIAVGTLEGGSAFATGSMDVIFVLFSTDAEIIDFLATALPNCIFEDLEIACDNEHLLDALGQVAESVIVRGAFSLPASVGPDDSIGIVRKLRKVKALRLRVEVNEDEVTELANFYRGSGVQELQYYRSPDAYPTPTIVALD